MFNELCTLTKKTVSPSNGCTMKIRSRVIMFPRLVLFSECIHFSCSFFLKKIGTLSFIKRENYSLIIQTLT
jgi:hypothetical protein